MDLKTSRMATRASGNLNQTITLDSSTDSDIIECSAENISVENNFFKTPRSHLKRKCTSATKNKVISLKGFQFKNENQQAKSTPSDRLNDSIISKLRSSCILNDSVGSVIQSTPERKNVAATPMNRLLSSLKKSPDLPYLSRSKLNRIEKWLVENDLENVKTPPFSNLSGTPRRKISSTPKTSTSSARKRRTPRCDSASDLSSIDSEVKKVLIAVYGNDWRNEKVVKKSKTEPKKSRKVISTKTDIKTRRIDVGQSAKEKPIRTVRRNIMKNDLLRRGLITDDKSDNLDNSFSLGVEKLNETGSSISLGVADLRGDGKTSASSSLKSWKPESVRKTRSETARNGQVGKGRSGTLKTAVSAEKTPMKTFLASLSVSTPKRRCHPEAQDFKINFKTKKEELAKKLFKLYNSEVFGSGLPDDMNISWNVKLRGTAGYCYNKKILKTNGQIIRLSRIEFSTKIIDRADRLRDTMIHELCHAASWVIDGMLDGHGSVWTKWARKAMERFPELPLIRRCHNYEIASKYTYRCTGCGYSINRHSKSINIDRKRCGYCFGVFELFVNKKKRGKGEVPEFNSTRTIPTPNNFALFVKENYHNVKSTKKDAKHAEIMKILSQQYALTKDTGKTTSAKK